MALEIKIRPYGKSVQGAAHRTCGIFIALDGRQFQKSGELILSDEELEALNLTAKMKVIADGHDLLLTNEEEE